MTNMNRKPDSVSESTKNTKEKLKDAGQAAIDKAKTVADKVADAGRQAVHKAEEIARDVKRKLD